MGKTGQPHGPGHHGDRKERDENRNAKAVDGPLSAAERARAAAKEVAKEAELDKKLNHPGWAAKQRERGKDGIKLS